MSLTFEWMCTQLFAVLNQYKYAKDMFAIAFSNTYNFVYKFSEVMYKMYDLFFFYLKWVTREHRPRSGRISLNFGCR